MGIIHIDRSSGPVAGAGATAHEANHVQHHHRSYRAGCRAQKVAMMLNLACMRMRTCKAHLKDITSEDTGNIGVYNRTLNHESMTGSLSTCQQCNQATSMVMTTVSPGLAVKKSQLHNTLTMR